MVMMLATKTIFQSFTCGDKATIWPKTIETGAVWIFKSCQKTHCHSHNVAFNGAVSGEPCSICTFRQASSKFK